MTVEDPMARSGARWCDKHARWECAANKPDHHASALRGQRHCKNCVGKTRELAKAQGEANLLAWSSEAGRDMPPLDTGQVVMDQLRIAVMRGDAYGELLRLQMEGEGVGGLVGTTYTAGGDGRPVKTGEQIRGLARLESEQRDRAVRFAKTAHDMGIAQQVVELAQGQARMIGSAFLAVCDALGLSPTDRARAIGVFMSRLRLGDGGTTGLPGFGVGDQDGTEDG